MLLRKSELPKILKRLQLFWFLVVETLSFIILYYSILNAFFWNSFQYGPIAAMTIILIYLVIRWRENRIAGIYMLKRVTNAAYLAYVSHEGGIGRNYALSMAILAIIEIVFFLMRYYYEDINIKDWL